MYSPTPYPFIPYLLLLASLLSHATTNYIQTMSHMTTDHITTAHYLSRITTWHKTFRAKSIRGYLGQLTVVAHRCSPTCRYRYRYLLPKFPLSFRFLEWVYRHRPNSTHCDFDFCFLHKKGLTARVETLTHTSYYTHSQLFTSYNLQAQRDLKLEQCFLTSKNATRWTKCSFSTVFHVDQLRPPGWSTRFSQVLLLRRKRVLQTAAVTLPSPCYHHRTSSASTN